MFLCDTQWTLGNIKRKSFKNVLGPHKQCWLDVLLNWPLTQLTLKQESQICQGQDEWKPKLDLSKYTFSFVLELILQHGQLDCSRSGHNKCWYFSLKIGNQTCQDSENYLPVSVTCMYDNASGVWQLRRDSDDWGRALHSWALWHCWAGGLRQTSPTFISSGDHSYVPQVATFIPPGHIFM